MLAGVSTRRYRRTQEPVGEQVEVRARSTSKSAVSRTFVERTREALGELMSRQLGDLRLAVMMLDGLELKGRMMIVALGITTEGVKIPLGLWEGSTENATVATALLSDLVERGLDPEQGMLFVLDGSKALRKAVRSVFGEVPVQRCLWHKERNVMQHLPERDRPPIKARLRTGVAGDRLRARARAAHPCSPASSSTRTPAPPARCAKGWRRRSPSSSSGSPASSGARSSRTNPCESMIDTVRTTQRNVKRWSSGEMGLRWTAAGMLEAEKQFRKVIGYTDLPRLAVAIERRLHLQQPNPATTQEAADRSHCVTITPGPSSPKFHDNRGNLPR